MEGGEGRGEGGGSEPLLLCATVDCDGRCSSIDACVHNLVNVDFRDAQAHLKDHAWFRVYSFEHGVLYSVVHRVFEVEGWIVESREPQLEHGREKLEPWLKIQEETMLDPS